MAAFVAVRQRRTPLIAEWFAGAQAKLIAAGILLLALAAAMIWFGAHERGIGAAKVQAKWDAATAAQIKLAVMASEAARTHEQAQSSAFASIATDYLQATTHDYPSISDALPAAVATGTVRLRDACPDTTGGARAEATARSRATDAASTQALADRVANSIAAVRAGDAADARERQLGAQVTALQAVLRAERQTQ
jgi:hypothetical protein